MWEGGRAGERVVSNDLISKYYGFLLYRQMSMFTCNLKVTITMT